MNVAIIGASNKHDRYSYMALKKLQEAGHVVYPVHKVLKEIDGLNVYACVGDIKDKIDTVTLYVNEDVSNAMAEDIIALNPTRIIFNPGTENYSLQELATKKGIKTMFACTLVLLSTRSF